MIVALHSSLCASRSTTLDLDLPAKPNIDAAPPATHVPPGVAPNSLSPPRERKGAGDTPVTEDGFVWCRALNCLQIRFWAAGPLNPCVS